MADNNDQFSWLPQDQRTKLELFREITQIADIGVCLEILNQNQWDVDAAVNSFVQDHSSETSNLLPHQADTTPSTARNVANVANISRPTNSSQNNALQRQGNGDIFELIISPLRWLFQTRPVSMNPELDTRNFIAEFDAKYGNQHPTFAEGSYQTAVARAFQQSKFLLVYLHSPMHEDTDRFCHQAFCTEEFSRFSNNQMVVWGGRIWDPEAYGLSSQLRAASFPFMALLVCQSERLVQIADRVQGFVEERTLIDRLRNSMGTYGEVLQRVRTEAARRQESQLLREQQDREYREAAERDHREQQRRQEEEAQRRREEEEARQKQEMEEAMELSRKQAKEASLKQKREAMAVEPEPGPDVAQIRFQLPQGAKVARRFHRESTVQAIYDYLSIYFDDNKINVNSFLVSTHFPKLDLEDMNATVQDVGLHPRGMLYVQDLDA